MRKVGMAFIFVLFVLGVTGGVWLYVEKKTRDDFVSQLRSFETRMPEGTQIVHGMVRIDIIGRRAWVENLSIIKNDEFQANFGRLEMRDVDVVNAFRSAPKRPVEYRIVVENGEVVLPRKETRDKYPLRFGAIYLTGSNLGAIPASLVKFTAAGNDAELLEVLRGLVMERKLRNLEVSDLTVEDPRDESDPDELQVKRITAENLVDGEIGRFTLGGLKVRLSKGRMDIRIDRLNSGMTNAAPLLLDLSATAIKGTTVETVAGLRDLLEKSLSVKDLKVHNFGLRKLTDEIFVNNISIDGLKPGGLSDKIAIENLRLEPSACRRDCLEIIGFDLGGNNLIQAIGLTTGALVSGEIGTGPELIAGYLMSKLDTASLNLVGSSYKDRQTVFNLGRVTADNMKGGVADIMSISRGEMLLPRQIEVQFRGADINIENRADGNTVLSGGLDVEEFMFRPDGSDAIEFEKTHGVDRVTFNAKLKFKLEGGDKAALTFAPSSYEPLGELAKTKPDLPLVGLPKVAGLILGVLMGEPGLQVSVEGSAQ